ELVGTILSSALAVLSIIPEAKVAQMAMLSGSSITASLLSESKDQPTLFSVTDSNLPQQIKDQLNAGYQALYKLNGDRTNRILTDKRLLPIVGRLAETVWSWQPDDFGKLPSL